MRAAVYLRQSEDRTGDEWGIERQREDVLRLVNARGWTVAGEFVDNDVSAMKRKPRPAFVAMMARVKAGEVDVVCAKHTDRLLRRVAELEELLEHLSEQGAFIVTTSEGVDTSTEAGRLVARILASVAQGEVERKSARHKAANKQAAQQGRWIGGRRPFGYTADVSGIIETEAALIRAAYSAILNGRTLHSIASEWNSMGVKTTLGNRWDGKTVRQVLIKPRYAGIRTYLGERGGEGLWEPIVGIDLWEAVNAILTSPGRQVAPTARKHLLSGILLCGKCLKPMGSAFNLNPVYKCKHCGGVSRQMAPVDSLVTKLLLAFMSTPQAAALRVNRNDANLSELREQKRTITERLKALPIELADGLLNAYQVKAATDRLNEKLLKVEASLDGYVNSRDVEELICENPQPIWEGYSLDRRRRAIRRSVELTLLPSGRGATFKPEHLRYRWLVED